MLSDAGRLECGSLMCHLGRDRRQYGYEQGDIRAERESGEDAAIGKGRANAVEVCRRAQICGSVTRA